MALQAAGGHATELARATAWLTGQRKAAGYWVSQEIPNANSTGLAAAALQGAELRREHVPLAGCARSSSRPARPERVRSATTASSRRPRRPATSPSVLATAQALTGLVDGGSLATVSAHGASNAVPMFAPHSSLSATTARPGSKQTVSGHGFAAGEQVVASVHSTPVTVAKGKADAAGAVKFDYTLPKTLTPGRHTVVLTGQTSGLVAGRSLTVPAPLRPRRAPRARRCHVGRTRTVDGGRYVCGPADTGQDRSQLDRSACSARWPSPAVWSSASPAGGRLAAGRHRHR